jgi:glycosyltransferase involved in cell wall biosynthesis
MRASDSAAAPMPVAPLSVLYFSNTLARGGAEEHILTLLRGLDRRQFRPLLVCAPEVAEQLRPDLPSDVELIPLPLRKPAHLPAALRLARILRRRQVSILHSHLFYSSLFASPIGWLCGVPLIVETPHVREQWRHGWLKGRFVVDRLAGRFVHRYIAVSEANARYLVKEKGLPARKISVIHNGCDVARFKPGHRAPNGLRQDLGFGPQDPALLIVGRLEPQKGHRILFEALPAIRREFPAVRVVCVGEGSLRSELEQRVDGLGLRDAVRFVGQHPNVDDWLALADVSILPSFYEGLPLVAIESLAAGKPMVATAVDGTPEVVVDGATGLTVPPGDHAELAHAICRLLGDPLLRDKLSRAGRRWVLERFTQDHQIQRTETLYHLALQHRRRPLTSQKPGLARLEGWP